MLGACLWASSKLGSAPFITKHKECSRAASEPSTKGTAGPLDQKQLSGSVPSAGKEVMSSALPWLQTNRVQTVSMHHLTLLVIFSV